MMDNLSGKRALQTLAAVLVLAMTAPASIAAGDSISVSPSSTSVTFSPMVNGEAFHARLTGPEEMVKEQTIRDGGSITLNAGTLVDGARYNYHAYIATGDDNQSHEVSGSLVASGGSLQRVSTSTGD